MKHHYRLKIGRLLIELHIRTIKPGQEHLHDARLFEKRFDEAIAKHGPPAGSLWDDPDHPEWAKL